LGGKPIGSLFLKPGGPHGLQIAKSEINPRFKGMGLGKQLYREALALSRTHGLSSDEIVSSEAQRVWASIGRRRPETLQVNPESYMGNSKTLLSRNREPIFSANLPSQASPATFQDKLAPGETWLPRWEPTPSELE